MEINNQPAPRTPAVELGASGHQSGRSRLSKRIGALKAQHQAIAKLHNDGEEQEHRRLTIEAYFHLRMAWERAVEEVLLREVILRFRKGVETQRLAGVMVEDDDGIFSEEDEYEDWRR